MYLCTVLMKNPNFLVLDEPTNDLDIAKSRNGITTIWMNDTHFKTFFRELWNKLQKVLGLDISRGLHL